MNSRQPTLLCVSLLLTIAANAQAPTPTPTQPATPPATQPSPAATTPPRRVPEPYKATIPPSPGDLTVWPRGVSPQEVGKTLAEHFVKTPLGETVAYPGRTTQGQNIGYPEVCTWYGALTFAEITHDEALRDELIARFAPVMPGGPEASRTPHRHHVDDSIFGVVPLQIAIQT